MHTVLYYRTVIGQYQKGSNDQLIFCPESSAMQWAGLVQYNCLEG